VTVGSLGTAVAYNVHGRLMVQKALAVRHHLLNFHLSQVMEAKNAVVNFDFGMHCGIVPLETFES